MAATSSSMQVTASTTLDGRLLLYFTFDEAEPSPETVQDQEEERSRGEAKGQSNV